ncbi:MAG: PAS domain-containing protein, partial [Mycobacteriaceae bacterium]|nr:PAS domain-containing protein [Mycobacteriaceae bacterium]
MARERPDKGRSAAAGPTAEALEVVSRSALPAVVLEVPSERIVAASDAALRLLGADRASVVGRSLEEFTADAPSGALDLVAAGVLSGYETSRLLRRPGAEPERMRVWVGLLDEATRGRYVLAVMSTAATPNIEPLPQIKEEGVVVGTVGPSLLIDRISHDVDELLHRQPEELLGQPFLTLVAEEDATALLWALAQAASSMHGVSGVMRVVTGQGSLVWAQLLLVPLAPSPSCAFALVAGDQPAERAGDGLDTVLHRLCKGVDAVEVSRDISRVTIASDRRLSRLT